MAFSALVMLALSLIFTAFCVSMATGQGCVCNPVLQINPRSCGSSHQGNQSDTVTVTTVMQENVVKEIFENVSDAFLRESETRLTNLINLIDDAAIPRDCQDIRLMGATASGVYTIQPAGTAGFPVYCDLTTAGGDWTVLQRRVNGSEDFFRGWNDYMVGFGDNTHEFWLGNQQIHSIVSQGWYELRIDMIAPNDERKYAGYHVFSIGDLSTKYTLSIAGYHGNAGDHMIYMNGMKFTTKDQDNDTWKKNCAVEFTGAWWYTACHNSNLNGKYGDTRYAKGLSWTTLTKYNTSLKWVEMKVRKWQRP